MLSYEIKMSFLDESGLFDIPVHIEVKATIEIDEKRYGGHSYIIREFPYVESIEIRAYLGLGAEADARMSAMLMARYHSDAELREKLDKLTLSEWRGDITHHYESQIHPTMQAVVDTIPWMARR